MDVPIKAAPTATIKGSPTPVSPGELSGRKNILQTPSMKWVMTTHW